MLWSLKIFAKSVQKFCEQMDLTLKENQNNTLLNKWWNFNSIFFFLWYITECFEYLLMLMSHRVLNVRKQIYAKLREFSEDRQQIDLVCENLLIILQIFSFAVLTFARIWWWTDFVWDVLGLVSFIVLLMYLRVDVLMCWCVDVLMYWWLCWKSRYVFFVSFNSVWTEMRKLIQQVWDYPFQELHLIKAIWIRTFHVFFNSFRWRIWTVLCLKVSP